MREGNDEEGREGSEEEGREGKRKEEEVFPVNDLSFSYLLTHILNICVWLSIY